MSTEFRVGPFDGADRIRLGPAVASGTEGVLYRGFLDRDDGPLEIAVKMLQPGHLERLSEWTARWREQVELLGRAKVPGLVGVHGGFVGPLPHPPGMADASTASLYLLMDWVEGVSLDRWAHTLAAPQPEQLLLVLVPVAAALDLLHSGAATGGVAVLHRDVKPANILIRPGGDTVLVDLGSVRGLDDAIRRSGVVGTPGYVAPEVRAEGRWGPEADRYSLGAVAFYLLTGEEPPLNADSRTLRDSLVAAPILHGRPEVINHILAMLDADPARRPSSLSNWVAQVRRSSLVALSGPVGLAPRAPGRHPTTGTGASEERRRRPRISVRLKFVAVAALLTSLLILLLGPITGLTTQWTGDASQHRVSSSATAPPTTAVIVTTQVATSTPSTILPSAAPATTEPAKRSAVPISPRTAEATFDHIWLGQVRVDVGKTLSPAALGELFTAAAPLYQYPKDASNANGPTGVLIYTEEGRVVRIQVNDRTENVFDTPGIAPGINLARLQQLVPGLTSIDLPASPAKGNLISVVHALYRVDGGVATYFVPAEQFSATDGQCHELDTVESVWLVANGADLGTPFVCAGGTD